MYAFINNANLVAVIPSGRELDYSAVINMTLNSIMIRSKHSNMSTT